MRATKIDSHVNNFTVIVSYHVGQMRQVANNFWFSSASYDDIGQIKDKEG